MKPFLETLKAKTVPPNEYKEKQAKEEINREISNATSVAKDARKSLLELITLQAQRGEYSQRGVAYTYSGTMLCNRPQYINDDSHDGFHVICSIVFLRPDHKSISDRKKGLEWICSITDFHVLCFRILRELLTEDGVEISDPYLYNEETRKKYSPNIKSAAARIPGVMQIAFDYKAVVDER